MRILNNQYFNLPEIKAHSETFPNQNSKAPNQSRILNCPASYLENLNISEKQYTGIKEHPVTTNLSWDLLNRVRNTSNKQFSLMTSENIKKPSLPEKKTTRKEICVRKLLPANVVEGLCTLIKTHNKAGTPTLRSLMKKDRELEPWSHMTDKTLLKLIDYYKLPYSRKTKFKIVNCNDLTTGKQTLKSKSFRRNANRIIMPEYALESLRQLVKANNSVGTPTLLSLMKTHPMLNPWACISRGALLRILDKNELGFTRKRKVPTKFVNNSYTPKVCKTLNEYKQKHKVCKASNKYKQKYDDLNSAELDKLVKNNPLAGLSRLKKLMQKNEHLEKHSKISLTTLRKKLKEYNINFVPKRIHTQKEAPTYIEFTNEYETPEIPLNQVMYEDDDWNYGELHQQMFLNISSGYLN